MLSTYICYVISVAANSIFGRWDDTKGDENIDFMPTILSRFDMIFIVKDEHNESRDMVMTCRFHTCPISIVSLSCLGLM